MGHSYYSYTKEELVGNGPKLPVIVMEDNAEVFHSMAVEMVDEIRKHNENGEKTVFICPVGPVGQYPYFVDMVNEQNISLKNVWFINMDVFRILRKRFWGFCKICRISLLIPFELRPATTPLSR